jgi:16S rRNA (uracil1498-N3)-methyltransferase
MIILEPSENGVLLPRNDRRWEHVKKVLKKKKGDRLSAGIIDGSVGTVLVRGLNDTGIIFDFEGGREPEPLSPLCLILGFPRPIQAGRILRDLTSLGVAEIHLVLTELGEKSYAESDFFRKREFRTHLIEGAEQAGNPLLPQVNTHWSLVRCLDTLNASWGQCSRIFFHPYGEPPSLFDLPNLIPPLLLAVGSERGWSETELALLEARGFRKAGLGKRILKTETAALAAAVLALARLKKI